MHICFDMFYCFTLPSFRSFDICFQNCLCFYHVFCIYSKSDVVYVCHQSVSHEPVETNQGYIIKVHNGELVIPERCLDQFYKYVLTQHSRSEQVRLQNHWASCSADIISMFAKGNGVIDVDAVPLMLVELGIEFEFSDWQALKLALLHHAMSSSVLDSDTANTAAPSELSIESIGESTGRLHSQSPQFPSQSQGESSDIRMNMDNVDVDDDDDDGESGNVEELFLGQETEDLTDKEKIQLLEEEVKSLKDNVNRKKALIVHLQGAKKMLQQRVRRLHKSMEAMNEKHQKELSKIKDEANATFHIQRTSDKPKAWLTPQGSVAVALRRNIGNVACSLLGHVVLQDLSGCTVSRCEVKSAAALVAHSQMFYEQMMHAFRTATTPAQCLSIHTVREDATNSGIWRKSKLANMEIESFYTTNMSSLDVAIKTGHTIRRLGDVQRVSDSSGMGTTTLCWKQMQSIGCPTWYDMSLVYLSNHCLEYHHHQYLFFSLFVLCIVLVVAWNAFNSSMRLYRES